MKDVKATKDSTAPEWGVPEVAEYTGLSRYFVRKLTAEGVFVDIGVGTHARYVPAHVVKAWREFRKAA